LDVWLRPTWRGSEIVLKKDFVNIINADKSLIPSAEEIKHYDVIVNTQWGVDEVNKYGLPNVVQCYNIPTKHEIINYVGAAYRLGYKGEVPEQWVGEWSWKDMFHSPIVGVHSGCFGGVWAKKRWDHFEGLTNKLLDNGFVVYNYGTKEEVQEIDDVNYYEYAGLTDLANTIDNMMGCGYFISNDSGLMHIADALGIPTVGIFGPTLVVKNRPVNKNSLVIQATKGWKDGCIPCQYTPNFNKCESNECLKNISADFVFDQFLKLRKELNEKESQES
jgi:ADP-heptose:LPS heptosyltransferase